MSDIKYKFLSDGDRIDLPGGLYATVGTPYDEDMGPPWKEHDGHGLVTREGHHRFGLGTKPPKSPGERILCWDHGYYRIYDFAGTMKIAKRDGWGLGPEEIEALHAKLGRPPTKGEITAESVERDFNHLRRWCDNQWHWIGVIVKLFDADGEEIDSDSIWGIEDDTDYWQEVASELVENLLEKHNEEQAEAQHWAERDTITTV